MDSQSINHQLLQSDFELKKVNRFVGFLQMPKALVPTLSRLGVSHGAITTYLTIASSTYFDKKNETYGRSPFTLSQLVELLGRHRNSVSRWLSELEEMGLLARTADDTWVVVHYEHIFFQRPNGKSTTLSKDRNFEQEFIKLFPKLTERRQ